MRLVKIGLVAEGKTDHIILQHLLAAALRQRLGDVECRIIHIQPYRDATSMKWDEGGWRKVQHWCLYNDVAYRQGQYLSRRGIFQGENPDYCDLLLFQLDADILEELRREPDALPLREAGDIPLSPSEKGEYVRQTLLHWLWPDGGADDPRQIPAPIVELAETWLVAGLWEHLTPEPQRPMFEAVPQAEILRALVDIYGAISGRKPKPNKKALKKDEEHYQPLCEQAALQVERISQRCPHFSSLVSLLENGLNQHLTCA